jgi:hypothetical protein
VYWPAFAWLGFKVDVAIAEPASVDRGIADSGRAIAAAQRDAPRAPRSAPEIFLGLTPQSASLPRHMLAGNSIGAKTAR